MGEIYLQLAIDQAIDLGPILAVFVVIALFAKRGALVQAWRKGKRETATNAALFVVNYILLVPVYIVPILAIENVMPNLPALSQIWEALWMPFAVALAIVLIDFSAYWRHRFEHAKEVWRFHATHHADEAMNWFSVTRKHPVSRLMSLLFDTLLLMALGCPAEVVVTASLLRTWWGYFIHADVLWTLGPLRHVLISPAAHRLHHIRDADLYGTNFGNTVTLWDKMFGTWLDPEPYLGCETGIEEGSRGVVGELIRPWEARYRRKTDPLEEAAA